MAKEKACVKCRTIYDEGKCPNCGETANIDSFKGEMVVFNSDKSIIAHNLGIKSNGRFAVKIK